MNVIDTFPSAGCDHQPYLAADPDPAGQEGEGAGLHTHSGAGHAQEEGGRHAGDQIIMVQMCIKL